MRKILSIFALLITASIPASPTTVDEAMARLNSDNVQFVDFAFTDLLGALYEITVPMNRVRSALENGIFFDGSSIPGCSQIFESDMLLKPDLSSMRPTVWLDDSYEALHDLKSDEREITPKQYPPSLKLWRGSCRFHPRAKDSCFLATANRTTRIMCDMYSDDTTPYEGSARHILSKVVDEARAMGFDFYVGAELEFFILDHDGKPSDKAAYCSAEGDVRKQAFNRALMNALALQGVNPEKIHHEVAPGQKEIVLRYGNPITIAENIIITKQTIKSWAQEEGLQATFMPKPIFGINGSGMHVHFSLFDIEHNCNAFYDANDAYKLSKTARHFIAGVLKYVPELNALLNSTINSYKRLVPGYEAPIYVCWGTKNRSALIRIPEVNDNQPLATRAEIRSPDALSNPYLVFATILKAGLEGIKQELTLENALDRNLYKLSLSERTALNIMALPASLSQAVDNLEASLMARTLLGDRLFKEFIQIKRKEIYAFNTVITDWELSRYN